MSRAKECSKLLPVCGQGPGSRNKVVWRRIGIPSVSTCSRSGAPFGENGEDMARYTIVRACGHESRVKVRGPMPGRERKLDRERQLLCGRCSIENRRAEAEAAAEAEDLPDLTGTPKQTAWAMTIRHKALADAEEYLDYLRDSGQLKGRVGKDLELFKAQKERVLEPLRAQTEAAWWINRRDESGANLLEAMWDLDGHP